MNCSLYVKKTVDNFRKINTKCLFVDVEFENQMEIGVGYDHFVLWLTVKIQLYCGPLSSNLPSLKCPYLQKHPLK